MRYAVVDHDPTSHPPGKSFSADFDDGTEAKIPIESEKHFNVVPLVHEESVQPLK